MSGLEGENLTYWLLIGILITHAACHHQGGCLVFNAATRLADRAAHDSIVNPEPKKSKTAAEAHHVESPGLGTGGEIRALCYT